MSALLMENDTQEYIDTGMLAGAGQQRAGKLWSRFAEVCDLLGVPVNSPLPEADLVFQRVQFKAGQRIHTIGQTFNMLYIVNSGFLKTILIDDMGEERVINFPMKGDLLGLDGIHSKKYESETIALSSCDIILVPFKVLTAIGRKYPYFETALYGVMSRELMREQRMVSMLGSLNSESRIARFLMAQSERFFNMGYSGKEFNLRMTRHEIGSYLGLTLETVSRTLSAFNELGLIGIDQRTVTIKDSQGLKTLRRLPPRRPVVKKAELTD